MHTPQIVMYYQKPDPADYLINTGYIVGYSELDQEVARMGGQLYVAGGPGSYLGANTFSPVWKLVEGQLEQVARAQADVIFDKGRFAGDTSASMFNPKFVNDVCTDKWLMYQLFSELCPLTKLVSAYTELPTAIGEMRTQRIVVKPQTGMEGTDILIGTAQEAPQYFGALPALVSEFVDSSAGIPGVMVGRHDLRIAILNGKIIYAEFKTPPPNSLVASVTRGGSYSAVPIDQLPAAALEIVSRVEQVMQREPNRFYAVDMMFGSAGPLITELNSRPAILPNSDGSDFAKLKTELAKVLVNLAHSAL